MRSLIIVAIGLVLAFAVVRLSPRRRRAVAATVFTVAWLVAMGWNLRTGLSHGYSLAEELPIHLALFGVPVALAWALWRWPRR